MKLQPIGKRQIEINGKLVTVSVYPEAIKRQRREKQPKTQSQVIDAIMRDDCATGKFDSLYRKFAPSSLPTPVVQTLLVPEFIPVIVPSNHAGTIFATYVPPKK